MNKDEKGHWLIDPNKHNPKVQEGKKYLIPQDYDWEGASPFRGLTCTVLQVSTYSKAGFDCFVKLDVEPEELALRYSVARGRKYSIEDIVEWHGSDNFDTDGFKYEPGLYVEHDTEFLTPLVDPLLNDLDREYAEACNALWDAKSKMNRVMKRAHTLSYAARYNSTKHETKQLHLNIAGLVDKLNKIENRLANVVIDTTLRTEQEIE